MRVTLISQRSDSAFRATWRGDELTINGERFDFSQLAEGNELPPGSVATAFVAGPVRRSGGVIELALVVPYGLGDEPRNTQVVDAEDGDTGP